MGGIDSYLKTNSKIKKFKKVAKGKKKKERRKIEQNLLKPESIPDYTGSLPKRGPVERRTIKIICDTETDIDIIKRYFKVSEYKELNIRDITLLMKLLNALEEGHLLYEEKTKDLFFISDQDERIRL